MEIATLTFVSLLSFISCFQRCSSIFAPSLPRFVRTPEFRFSSLPSLGYPWEPNYLQVNLNGLPSLRMHYLDIGPANAPETILLVHGTPAWSFLYRKIIPPLIDAGFRVISPDFIGFGRSDKLTEQRDYTHKLHVQSLLQLVRFLNLQGVTLFGHDLGGPTGLSVVRREKDRFKRLVLFNTWIPQGNIFSSLQFALRHLPYLTWRVVTRILGKTIPIKLVFVLALGSGASPAGLTGFVAPFPSFIFKAGPAQWPLLVPMTSNEPMAIEMQKVKLFLEAEWTGPVLYGYSDREFFTIPGRDLFRQMFRNNGCEVLIVNSGHFPQEDQPKQVTSKVLNFINQGC